MYCSNCGNFMPDGTKYCPVCGTEQEAITQPGNAPIDPTTVLSKKHIAAIKIAAIGAVAVVVTVLVAVICSALFGGGKETALKDFCKAIEKGDGVAMLEAMYPDDAISYFGMKAEAGSMVDEFFDIYGDDLDVSYEVRKEEKLERRALKDFGDYLEDTYDLDPDELSKAYLMEVKLTISGDGQKDSEKSWIVSYKYDGDWYFDTNAYRNVDSIYDLKEDLS